mmetsp:Transcript_36265/g.88586  ORF Transcript_36265/g.88586 Transcript_36265/m.88586 type:complete len:300 (-) Transcript_36265:35-934(-)
MRTPRALGLSIASPRKPRRSFRGFLNLDHDETTDAKQAEALRVTAGVERDAVGQFEELCELSGRRDLSELYRTAHVRELLKVYSPSTLVQHLAVAEAEWQRYGLCPPEWRTDVEDILRSGAALVRGQDREGHPIIWIREANYGAVATCGARAYCAALLWITLFAVMQRPCEVPFVTIVCDEADKPPLGYNLEGLKLWIETMEKLCTPRGIVWKVYLVTPKLATKTLLKFVGKSFPAHLRKAVIVKNRDAVFNIASDPADVPLYFGSKGTPIAVDSTTSGDFDSMFLSGDGLSMKCVFNP